MRSILFLVLAGSAVATPARAAAQSEEQAARQVIERGERLFQRTCMRCHNAMEADERTNRQWQMIVPQMRELANITREEARAIIAYLIAENEEEAADRSEGAPIPGDGLPRSAPPGSADRQAPTGGRGSAGPQRTTERGRPGIAEPRRTRTATGPR